MDEKVLKDQMELKIENIFNDINLQTKIIQLILDPENTSFREQIWDIIKLDFFESQHHKFILKYLIHYINRFNEIPKQDTLKIILSSHLKNQDEKEQIFELVDYIFNNTTVYDKEYITEITLNFFRKQSFKKSLIKAAENFESGEFVDIASSINEAIKKFEPKSKGHDYIKDVKLRMVEKVRKVVPCMPGLNEEIGGGLANGELGIILAPTGGGKSMLLVAFAAEAFKCGKKVLYITLELEDVAVGKRFDAYLNNVPLSYIREYEEIVTETTRIYEAKGSKLIIEPYLSSKPTINTIKNKILSLKRESDFKPDVVFVDYADLMKPSVHYSEKRHSLTDIYENLRNLANELELPIWTASQVNRGGYDTESFSLSNIAEDMGKANTADLILGIVRGKKEKQNKVAKLMVMKNRNGKDGYDLDMKFDTIRVQMEITSGTIKEPILNGLSMEKNLTK